MRPLAAVSSVLTDIVGIIYLSPTNNKLKILLEHPLYIVVVGYYDTGVQVVEVPLFDVSLSTVLDFEVDLKLLDQLYIARLADYQGSFLPAPAVAAVAATTLYQLVN